LVFFIVTVTVNEFAMKMSGSEIFVQAEISRPEVDMANPGQNYVVFPQKPAEVSLGTRDPSLKPRAKRVSLGFEPQSRGVSLNIKEPKLGPRGASIGVRKSGLDLRGFELDIRKPTLDLREPKIVTMEFRNSRLESRREVYEGLRNSRVALGIETRKTRLDFGEPKVESKKPRLDTSGTSIRQVKVAASGAVRKARESEHFPRRQIVVRKSLTSVALAERGAHLAKLLLPKVMQVCLANSKSRVYPKLGWIKASYAQTLENLGGALLRLLGEDLTEFDEDEQVVYGLYRSILYGVARVFDTIAGESDRTHSSSLVRFALISFSFGVDRALFSFWDKDPLWSNFDYDQKNLFSVRLVEDPKIFRKLPFLADLRDYFYVYFREDGFDPCSAMGDTLPSIGTPSQARPDEPLMDDVSSFAPVESGVKPDFDRDKRPYIGGPSGRQRGPHPEWDSEPEPRECQLDLGCPSGGKKDPAKDARDSLIQTLEILRGI
jgi:hypothetical protein